jgi:hypothetical protein
LSGKSEALGLTSVYNFFSAWFEVKKIVEKVKLKNCIKPFYLGYRCMHANPDF